MCFFRSDHLPAPGRCGSREPIGADEDKEQDFAVAFKTFDQAPAPHPPCPLSPSTAVPQASKLGLGASRAITSFYDNAVVVHMKHDPLLTSFFADKAAAGLGGAKGLNRG